MTNQSLVLSRLSATIQPVIDMPHLLHKTMPAIVFIPGWYDSALLRL